MKFFAVLFVLCGIIGFALAATPASSGSGSGTIGTGTSVGTGTGTGTSTGTATTTTKPCENGPQGPCGLIPPCLVGSPGCGQKVYIFN